MIRSFAAALFLTAVSFTASHAQTSPTPTPSPTVSTSVSTTPDRNLPVSATENTNRQVQPSTYTRPDANRRFKRYLNSMFGPVSLGRNVATAGIATWRNSPEEWGGQWEGFGRRVASNFGKSVIRNTTIYGLDEVLKLDSGFYRSKNKSVKSRVINLLISPVTARRPNGKRTIGIPRIVGTYTSSVVAYETWYPARYDYKDGLKSATISLGFNAAFNLFKEFVLKK